MKKIKSVILILFILIFTLTGCAKKSTVFKDVKIDFALTNITNDNGNHTFYYLDDEKNVKTFTLERRSKSENIDFRINEERDTPYVFIEGAAKYNIETDKYIPTKLRSKTINGFELVNNEGIDAIVELSTEDFNKLVE